MIEYGHHLYQKTIETNWNTARHTQVIILQEIERGKCSWWNTDLVEKNCFRNMAGVITSKQNSGPSGKSNKSNSKEKICTQFNNNNCKQGSDHMQDRVIYKHCCSYCHQESGRFYAHKVQHCLRCRSLNLF